NIWRQKRMRGGRMSDQKRNVLRPQPAARERLEQRARCELGVCVTLACRLDGRAEVSAHMARADAEPTTQDHAAPDDLGSEPRFDHWQQRLGGHRRPW